MSSWRYWLLFAFTVGSCVHAFAQGTVRGKISDENGESLIGVSVFLKENPSVGVPTDLDGFYSLNVPANEEHTLSIAYVSYTPIETKIKVAESEVLILDFVMTAQL